MSRAFILLVAALFLAPLTGCQSKETADTRTPPVPPASPTAPTSKKPIVGKWIWSKTVNLPVGSETITSTITSDLDLEKDKTGTLRVGTVCATPEVLKRVEDALVKQGDTSAIQQITPLMPGDKTNLIVWEETPQSKLSITLRSSGEKFDYTYTTDPSSDSLTLTPLSGSGAIQTYKRKN